MSRIVAGAGVVAIVGIAAGIWLQHRDNGRLRQEMAVLRDEVRLAASAWKGGVTTAPPSSGSDRAVETGSRNSDRDELAKLREEIVALRKQTQPLVEFAQLAQAGAALKNMGGTENSVATKLTPADALKNAGRATPEAATETVLWAAVGGDVDALASSFVFTPTAREKADAWFASLAEGTRKQYGSPEKIIALMIAKDAAGLSGMQVIGQKEVAPDNVGVRVRFGSVDGNTKDDNLVMRRSTDGWRMVIPDNTVEKFARRLGGGG